MRSDFLVISFILTVVFASVFAFSYMNKRKLGPARRKARAEQLAFCKVHGKKLKKGECTSLFVGLPPAVWDDLRECDGTKEPVVCRARRLCDLGSAQGCVVAGRLSGDESLKAKGCAMGYEGKECREPGTRESLDLLQAMRGARPGPGWSVLALSYACGEGDADGCALLPDAWFRGRFEPDSLPQAVAVWTDSCLWGSDEGCFRAGRALGSEPLVIHACISGNDGACAYLGSRDPLLGPYFITSRVTN